MDAVGRVLQLYNMKAQQITNTVGTTSTRVNLRMKHERAIVMKTIVMYLPISKLIWTISLICAMIASAAGQNNDDVLREAQMVPEFALSDLYGNSVTSEELKGNFLVIHIATTWCPYCNAEAPYLEKMSNEYADLNVKVLIIDVRESRDLVYSRLQERFNFTFPVLLDIDGSVAASFAPDDTHPDLAKDEIMIASNILVDPQGKIEFLSLLDSKNFDSELKDLKTRLHELLNIN